MFACMRTLSVALSHTQSADAALVYALPAPQGLGGRARGCVQEERETARPRAILTPLPSYAQRWQARAELPNEPPVATAFE